jgi:hypothetical protein
MTIKAMAQYKIVFFMVGTPACRQTVDWSLGYVK